MIWACRMATHGKDTLHLRSAPRHGAHLFGSGYTVQVANMSVHGSAYCDFELCLSLISPCQRYIGYMTYARIMQALSVAIWTPMFKLILLGEFLSRVQLRCIPQVTHPHWQPRGILNNCRNPCSLTYLMSIPNPPQLLVHIAQHLYRQSRFRRSTSS